MPRRELEDLLDHFHRACGRIPDSRQRRERSDRALERNRSGFGDHRVRRHGGGAVLVLPGSGRRRQGGHQGREGNCVQS